jgi:hypothetical protein
MIQYILYWLLYYIIFGIVILIIIKTICVIGDFCIKIWRKWKLRKKEN